MRLLLIGGTRFLGRTLAADAIGRGWDVTVFHRGSTPNPHPGVREVLGDRAVDLDRATGTWDAVVDTCGYMPQIVGVSAQRLRERAAVYAFISSLSVYPDEGSASVTEDASRRALARPVDAFELELYGELKAASEDAVTERWGSRALIVRPGLIVGPWDHTDRFGYWVRRVARGGDVLAPGDGTFRVRFVDVRDLARFILDRIAAGSGGTYNVQGPQQPPAFAELLARIAAIAHSDARVTWVDPEFLLARGVEPWSELPLWAPGNTLLDRAVSDAAVRDGLRFTPVDTTVADTLAWEREHAVAGAALKPDREAELLAEWRR